MDIDINYQDTMNKFNYSNKSLHENVYAGIMRKKDNVYADYIKTQKKYSKFFYNKINIYINIY